MAIDCPKMPPSIHPIESLVELAKDGSASSIRADVLVCCGDLANKFSKAGLNHAWDMMKTKLKAAFDAKAIFCTIGNHDVGRREEGNPFEAAQNMDGGFPVPFENDKNMYWSRGFCLQTTTEPKADFLLINTSYHHWSEAISIKGTFSPRQIADLDRYL